MSAVKSQLSLHLPAVRLGWGGRRPGAGRPKKPGAKTTVPHGRRPYHDARHPTHVTVRVRKRVGSLRRWHVAQAVGLRLRQHATSETAPAARRRRTFRVIHFSIQSNHVHLICEASSAAAMSRGLQGLLAHVARRVNRKLGRRGSLFGERHHRRDLATPLEVRRAIAYVLLNSAKHDVASAVPDLGTAPVDGIDPLSDARWFGGWQRPPPLPDTPAPVCRARTWLAAHGWRRHGRLGRDESLRPAGASS
jgi:REP element-mobilizing transposase RayT